MSVSSILSTRSTGWRIDVRLASLMDSIFAIGFGLGLRFVVDTVSDHDFKVTSTLVGLWEGVIMLHFTKKMPKSSDPFIAYGVRLFVDFLYTESVTRLVLVLVWTALGMVLADVTPGIWYEVGLRRVWRRFRRDIYTMLQMIPTVAFFPPTRTVRFSPSREPSTITEVDADADAVPPSSVIMTEQTPTTNTVPTTTAPAAGEILRRRVPGYFPADFSDTETELGSVRLAPSPGERTSRRLSVYPVIHDFEESVSSQNDLDEENLSSVSSGSTERPGASSTVIDASVIPDMYAEEPLVDVAAAPVKDEEEMKTPKQSSAPYMPPTPSDSAMHLFRRQPSEDPLLVRPPSEFMPQIPDFLDEANTEEWENIQRQEATEEKPPTPPAKDAAYKLKAPIIPAPVPPQPQLQRSTPSPEDESKGWDMLDSQFISNPNDSNNNATSTDPQVQTYDDDDMYGDVAPEYSTFPAMGESSTTEPPPVPTTDFTSGIFGPDTDPWTAVEEAEHQQREAARKQQEEEDALKKKQEEEEAEARRLEEERVKEKKAQEKAERLKKEAKDDAIRKKKREEDEAAERKRKEEADAAAERKRKEEEEAEEQQRKEEERKRKEEEQKREEEEQKRKEDEKRREKEAAEQKKEEEKQRKKEEAEQKKREEAERKNREEEEKAAAKAKKLAKEVEAKRLKEEAAEKKRLEEEADALAAAVAQAIAEEEERKKEEEAEAKKLQEESEAARVRAVEKEKQIKAQEEANQGQEAEERGRTEVTQTEPIPPSETRPPNDAEQDPEKDLPPQPLESQADGESTTSEASGAPSNEPSDRLDRMLLLRAQMVQMEGRLNDLTSPDSDQEIKQTEKILRKMRRQAERRYAAGISVAQHLDDRDEDDTVSLEGVHPKTSEKKIEEKIEALLSPDARSLFVKIVVAKRAADAKKQKVNVVMLLDRYNLALYTSENAANKKISIVDIPEEHFAEWLTGYRTLSTRRAEPDKEPVNFSVWG